MLEWLSLLHHGGCKACTIIDMSSITGANSLTFTCLKCLGLAGMLVCLNINTLHAWILNGSLEKVIFVKF